MPRYSSLAGLIALSLAGLGVSRGDVATPPFNPALCEQSPPAELLAIADWPLDMSSHGCDVPRGEVLANDGGTPVVELSWSDFTVRAVEVVERSWSEFAGRSDPPAQVVERSWSELSGREGPPAEVVEREWADLAPAATAVASVDNAEHGLQVHPVLARDAELAAYVERMARHARETWPGPTDEIEGADAVSYWYGDLSVDHAERPVGDPWAGMQAGGGEPVQVAGVALKAVDEHALDEMRGGFEMPGGLKLSFGLERLVYINGELANATRLTVADLGKLTGGSIDAAALPALGSTLAVIQNGPNNTLVGNALSTSALATVIQNSLDNQQIRTVTTIDVTVNSMELLRAQRLGESMRDVVRLR